MTRTVSASGRKFDGIAANAPGDELVRESTLGGQSPVQVADKDLVGDGVCTRQGRTGATTYVPTVLRKYRQMCKCNNIRL